MGGLQHKLIDRSKNISGDYTLILEENQQIDLQKLWELSKDFNISIIPEIEEEVLLKNGPYMAPAIFRGIPSSSPQELLPLALKAQIFDGLIIGSDLAMKLRARENTSIQIITPSQTDLSFDEIPRLVSEKTNAIILTDVPEVDAALIWSRDSLVWNLLKQKYYNQLRIYSAKNKMFNIDLLKEKLKNIKIEIQSDLSWEQQNEALSSALKLESKIMLFLFSCISLLVTLSMASGLIVFFNKINLDLVGMWILGMSKKNILRHIIILTFSMILFSILAGIILGTLFLFLLDSQGGEILPSIFVDRKIPVLFSYTTYLLSGLIPLLIGSLLIPLVLRQFRAQSQFLEVIRGKSL